MKVAFYDYQLKMIGTNQCKNGALVRFSFNDGYGYADCHPLVEFGDDPLELQKYKLKRGEFTPITSRAADFAKLDADARLENRSLFRPEDKVKSHCLLLNLLQENELQHMAFGFLKIKLKGQETEIAALNNLKARAPNLKWRLDFNSKLTYLSFCKFLDKIDLSMIDFIEDPFPFDEELWQAMEKKYSIQLAADFEKKKINKWLPKVLIVKPAIDSLDQYKDKNARIIITSYLAHPFEQLTAAYSACQIDNGETMGLFSHKVFEPNRFSEYFGNNPDSFFQNLGSGFGFDNLLEELSWHD